MSSSANNSLRAQIWIGMTAMCEICDKLIVVVDAYEDYPEMGISKLEWRHATGYYACYFPTMLFPQVQAPDMSREPAWEGHPTERRA